MEMKLEKIISAYAILKPSKMTKLEIKGKSKILKIMRVMRPTCDEWNSFVQTVDENIKKDNHDEIIEKVKKWQLEGENTTLSENERIEINKYLIEYQRDKEICINDELKKEISLEYEKLNESEFEQLVDSNDWKVEEILLLEEVIKE